MAKIKHCAFCGKEVTMGLFKKTGHPLYLSPGLEILCCQECSEKYEEEALRIGERFMIKVFNYQEATHTKLDVNQVKDFFFRYLEEERQAIARGGEVENYYDGPFYVTDGAGHFAIKEATLYGDLNIDDMIDSLKNMDDVCPVWFSKDDITQLEYRMGIRETSGVFSSVFSFDIRLNDEKQLSFKPCIARAIFKGTSILGSEKKKAREECIAALQQFNAALGANFPIVEVKEFR